MINKTKNVAFYSPDFNMCYSFLVYLQDIYNVTTTTDLKVLEVLVNKSDINLVIIDDEPSKKIEALCKNIRCVNAALPVILTYVFKNQLKNNETDIRQYVSSIFYKPFDLNEISMKLSALML
ncbi:MAG: hypothetical protein K8H86_03300 [Ignavibacteriaceae bacterium]|nr:hypothetical protein [Ignavibacteriaceae bacterium]